MHTHESGRALWSRADAHPDRVAVDAGERSLTYGALARRVAKLSAWMRTITPHGMLAVHTDDPALAIPALLASMDAGWTYAPVDPAWPAARVRAVLDALAPAAMLCHASAEVEAGGARRLSFDAVDALREGEPACAENPGAANVFFTSGTTGRPKGIMGRPGAAMRYVAWEARMLGLGEGLRVSALAPTTFDASLRDALLPLTTGGTICVPPDRGVFADGARLARWLTGAGVQVLHTVPTVFRALLASAPDPASMPSLQAVLLAGEPLRPSDVARFFALESLGQRVALYNLYGPTETTMTRLCHRVTPADANGRTVPIGAPMDDTEVFIIDSAGRQRGTGRPGEIVLRTPWASLGYLGQPDETARVFVPDLLGDGVATPVYRTGDLGVRREDGTIEFRGRRDLQVKLRGVRVELEEVEAALSAAPGVEAAAAALRDGPDGAPRLAAWVVGDVTPEAVREVVAQTLPGAAVPTFLIVLDALPRLLNGKVDRAALRLPTNTGAGVSPSGPVEQRVAAIVQEVLGGEVGATDDVFLMGMSSLQALQALWRLNEVFCRELPIDLLYTHRTVRALAAHLDTSGDDPGSAERTLWSTTTLCEGAPDAPRTFWLPPAYGLTMIYRELLAHADLGRAVGVELTQPTDASLEALARGALAEVRRVQPQGPYRLAGWSFGGVLAFAIARLLGPAQVAQLVLLDSAAPGDRFDFVARDADAAALAARRVGHMFGLDLSLNADALRGLDALTLCEHVLDLASARGLPVTDALRERARTVVAVREASMRAWRVYRPGPYPGPALVVRAAEAEADWTSGWDTLLTGPITRHVVPGTHVGMMDEPHLSSLADTLQRFCKGSL